MLKKNCSCPYFMFKGLALLAHCYQFKWHLCLFVHDVGVSYREPLIRTHDQLGFIGPDRGFASGLNLPVPVGMFMPPLQQPFPTQPMQQGMPALAQQNMVFFRQVLTFFAEHHDSLKKHLCVCHRSTLILHPVCATSIWKDCERTKSLHV